MTTKSRSGASHSVALVASALVATLLFGQVGDPTSPAHAQQQSSAAPQRAVAALVAEWLGFLSNESVSGLTGLYAAQATLTWGGTVGIFGGGVFSGQGNVRLLYSALFENTTLLTASATLVNTTLVSPSTVNSTFGLELGAQRGSGGTFQFQISVEQEWGDQNGTWTIQKESWVNNDYAFNAVTSTSTRMLALGSQWVVTPYPLPPGPPNGVENESCVTDSDFLYCIGGGFVGAGVYYAQLGLDGGAGPWKNTTAYPVPIESESCVAFTVVAQQASVLCVGGKNPDGSGPTNQTYLAQLSPDGGIVGSWTPELSYPIPISGANCVVDSGIDGFTAVQVICIGGDTVGDNPTSSVFYAPVFQGGISDWNSTTSYPVEVDSHSCIMAQVYIYCVDGLVNHSFTDDVRFALASSSGGISGGWNQTAPYPIKVANTGCVTSGGYDDYVFCVGGLIPRGGATGDVFYAHLSHSGGGIVGSWMPATSFNGGFDYNSCVEAISTIWCDWAGGIAYDEILGPDAPTVTRTETVASATATVTETSTTTAVSNSTITRQVAQASLLPEVYGLFGIAATFAVATVVFAARRRS